MSYLHAYIVQSMFRCQQKRRTENSRVHFVGARDNTIYTSLMYGTLLIDEHCPIRHVHKPVSL